MMRVVIDTGVLISGLIRPAGIVGDVLRGLRDGRFIPIYSTPILLEIIHVLSRPVFQSKYHVATDDITALINLLRLRGEMVIPRLNLTVCRDPKDNKFLEAAISGGAEVIITGDDDLLALNTYERIEILRPTEFLDRLFQ
ncbi:MAG: putative toxin-antitoxin system toxin component, PIN family [Chloroflexota bacterium]